MRVGGAADADGRAGGAVEAPSSPVDPELGPDGTPGVPGVACLWRNRVNSWTRIVRLCLRRWCCNATNSACVNVGGASLWSWSDKPEGVESSADQSVVRLDTNRASLLRKRFLSGCAMPCGRERGEYIHTVVPWGPFNQPPNIFCFISRRCCASSERLAVGRASRRPMPMGSPVSSQYPYSPESIN